MPNDRRRDYLCNGLWVLKKSLLRKELLGSGES
jgi:hypothetical protein